MSLFGKFEHPSEENKFPTLHLKVTNAHINQLHAILQRALNCADPQKYKDWVELCDKLDSLKRDGKI